MARDEGLAGGRKMRGTPLSTKLALAVGVIILVFMLAFTLVLQRFIREAVTEQLKLTALESALTASQADVEAWTTYFGTPYQGLTSGEVQAIVDGFRDPEEYKRKFLTAEQAAVRERNVKRFQRFGELDGKLEAVELTYFDDGVEKLRASYTGFITWVPEAGGELVLGEGRAVRGLLTHSGLPRHVAIRGTHPVRDTLGEVAGEFAVYIDARAIDETTDALILQISYGTAIFVILGVACAVLIGRQVTRPLKLLQDDIRLVAGGDLTHHTKVNSNDEIGELARTFDRMTRSLAEAAESERSAARSRHDVSLVAEVAEKLLPQKLLTIPGYDVAAHHEAAGEVAHELYDVLPMADGRRGLLVASASGSGVAAAMIMAMARSFLTAVARSGSDPGAVLREVNGLLSGHLNRGMFVTMLLVVLDPKTGAIDIANAGHPALVLHKGSGGKTLEVHSEGIALGFDAGPVFDRTLVVRALELEPGDRIVLGSEGVLKLRGADGKVLGDKRWVGLVKREGDHPSKVCIQRIASTLTKFRGKHDLDTDVTLVALGRQA